MSPLPSLTNTCPFCGQPFVHLDNHLPHCKQRHEQNYTSLLVKRQTVPSCLCCVVCPKCNCIFKRLDSHLHLSTTYRDIASPAAGPHPDLPMLPTQPMGTAFEQTTTVTASLTAPTYKTPHKLSMSTEKWEEADCLMQSAVVPMVLDVISAEDKNSCLCNGVYDVLISHFGTRPSPRSQRKAAAKQKQHDRTLKRVTRLKNETRQTLRHAKRQGETGSTLNTLAANFCLFSEHTAGSKGITEEASSE